MPSAVITLKSAGKELTISFKLLLKIYCPLSGLGGPPFLVFGQGSSKVTYSTQSLFVPTPYVMAVDPIVLE